ncbi:hypothetical protein, partial [Bathymodiolus thermophilus thioautotrophic gill symbiont]
GDVGVPAGVGGFFVEVAGVDYVVAIVGVVVGTGVGVAVVNVKVGVKGDVGEFYGAGDVAEVDVVAVCVFDIDENDVVFVVDVKIFGVDLVVDCNGVGEL